LLKDPWVQIFAFLALMSGGLSAQAQFSPAARRAPIAPPEKSAAGAEPPAIGPAATAAATRVPEAAPANPPAPTLAPGTAFAPMLTPMLEPVTPAPPTGAITRALKARTAGLWVVDASGGPDADATALSDVLASAKDGDVVFIHPGRYSEKITVAGSVTLRGTGADRGAVVIDSDGPLTAAVGRGAVRLEHLTLMNSGPISATVLAASGAALTLVDVAIEAKDGQGLRVTGGAVEARDVRLAGRIALIVDAAGRATITRGDVAGSLVGALVDGAGAFGEFVKTRFHDGTRQILVQRQARASVSGCDFDFTPGTRGLGAIVALSGARVSAVDARIHLNRAASIGLAAKSGSSILGTRVTIDHSVGFGAWASAQSNLTLTDSTVEDTADSAVLIEDSRVTLKRTTLSRSSYGLFMMSRVEARVDDSHFESNRFGPLVAYRGDEYLLSLSGTGNVGVEMHLPGLRLLIKPPPRAIAAYNAPPPGPGASPAAGAGPSGARAPEYSDKEMFDPKAKPVLLR
jgi:hypothetical protein